MAFKTKKRQPAPVEEIDSTSDETTPSSGFNPNVVATQFWVIRILRKFWNWTKFFATNQLKVTGLLDAGVVKTPELQTNDIYATKITLFDSSKGKPAEIYVQDGSLIVNYEFNDVFVYPSDDLTLLKYVYVNPQIENFVGLTSYETFLNFVPYVSEDTSKHNDKDCPRLCSADGKHVPSTLQPLLIKCPQTRKITGLQIVDENGNEIKFIPVPENQQPTKLLTINMPYFMEDVAEDSDNAAPFEKFFVKLPSASTIDAISRNSVIPPYMRPTPPCNCVPPPRPYVLPDDLFNDDPIPFDNSLFDNVVIDDSWVDFKTKDRKFVQVNENYVTDTYSNMALFNDDFNLNEKQFLCVQTEAL